MQIGYYFGVPSIAVNKYIGFQTWKSGKTRSVIKILIENENIPIIPEAINFKWLKRECEKIGIKFIQSQKNSKIEIKHIVLSLIKFDSDIKTLLRNILIENHPIVGFKISKEKYTRNIEARFVNHSLEEFEVETGIYSEDWYNNQYLLKHKLNSKKTLYLCKEKTLNPVNFRLMLKTHEEDFLKGLYILSKTDLKKIKGADVDPINAFNKMLKNYEKKTGKKYSKFNGTISNNRVNYKSDPIMYFVNKIDIPIFKDSSGKISLVPKGSGDFENLLYFKKMVELSRNIGIIFESEDYRNWMKYLDYCGETDQIKQLENKAKS